MTWPCQCVAEREVIKDGHVCCFGHFPGHCRKYKARARASATEPLEMMQKEQVQGSGQHEILPQLEE